MNVVVSTTGIKSYFEIMRRRGRIIAIYQDGTQVGWCTYMVGKWEDVKRFHNRRPMSVVDDLDDGPVIYIDYLSSVRWCREIRNAVYTALRQKHPSFKLGVWYRPTKTEDRMVVWEA